MIELRQYAGAPYPDAARWALDYMRIEYRSVPLLPGPQLPPLRRLTGTTSQPVLCDGRRSWTGTAGILAALETRNGESDAGSRTLLPDNRAERDEIWTIVRRFGDELAPWIQLAACDDLLPHARYTARLWSAPFAPLVRAGYVASFALLVRPLLRNQVGLTPARATEARRVTTEALDWIADRTRDRDYLVGDGFSLADLAAAGVLHAVAAPPSCPAGPPRPYPRGVRRWLERWHRHPGTAWVRRIYGLHRQRASLP